MASVYPNPSAGRFIITVSGNTGEPVSIRVLDVAGRIIYTAFGNNTTFYFGEKFVPGVYIAEAGSGNNSTRIKIIKQ